MVLDTDAASWLGPFPNKPVDLLVLLLLPNTELPIDGLESFFSVSLVNKDDAGVASLVSLLPVGVPKMELEVEPDPPNIEGELVLVVFPNTEF